MGYSDDILKIHFNRQRVAKGLVFDLCIGDIIKLAADSRVALARHGHADPNFIYDGEIQRRYGQRWQHCDTLASGQRSPDYVCFHTFLDTPMLVDL